MDSQIRPLSVSRVWSQSFTIIATNGEVLRSFVVRVGGRSVNAESWLSLPGKGEFVARRQKQKNPAAVFLSAGGDQDKGVLSPHVNL